LLAGLFVQCRQCALKWVAMTFSIVAVSEDHEWLGVAVASRVLAVGRAVAAAAVGAGAIATQAHCNMTYRPRGLELLKSGLPAADVVAALLAADTGPDGRQVGVVDRNGGSATYTGPKAWPWAGGRTGPGYAIQGNILAGPHVVEAMERTWLSAAPGEPFNRRLVKALLAGDRAGGDRRGRQSAAILVVTPDGAHESDTAKAGGHYDVNDEHTNLRVDDHADPVFELSRLVGLNGVTLARIGSGPRLPLAGALRDEVALLLDRVGHRPDGSDAAAVSAAVLKWAFTEDLDDRLTADKLPPDQIDPVVVDYLRYRAGESFGFGSGQR
jgi:uncharacterized Ntn-hydrolase superfamily protein